MPSFRIDVGSGTTFRGQLTSVPFQVAQTSRPVPDAPTGQRGYNNANKILVVQANISTGGIGHSNGKARAKIWKSNDDFLAFSTLEDLPNVGTAVVAPTNSMSYFFPGTASGTSSPAAILDGGSSYRFGLLGTTQQPIAIPRRSTTSYSIHRQTSGSATSSFSATNTSDFASSAIIGTIDYVVAPTAPSAPTASNVTTSTMTINVPTYTGDNGGASISGYRLEFKYSSGTEWFEWGTDTASSFDITGLDAGTSYNFRLAAINAATEAFGNWSAYSTSLTVSTSAAAPSWTDNTLAAFNANIPYSDAVSASNANQYSVSAGTLPTGITFNTDGTVTGTPTVAQQAYDFTLRATNTTNSLFISQTFSGTVGGSDQPIKVYVGGSYPGNVNGWINGTVRVFNGSDWVTPIIKVYNGASWVTPAG
jgi:hypothetical protein